MLSPEWLNAVTRYNRWMNEKIYGAAATLTDDERKRDQGAYFKSIHGTLNHLLLTDRVWLARFKGVPIADDEMAPGIRSLDQELYIEFDDLRRERAATDDELAAVMSTLTPTELAAPLVYRRFGKPVEATLWWGVAHLFNHQTHHRGQITTLLAQRGHDVGVTDLFAMLRGA